MLSRIHNPEFQFVFHQLAGVMFVCLFQIVDLLFFTAKKYYWAVQQQSKARNSDSKYRQMALVGFDT